MTPVQIAVSTFEILLLIAGAALLGRALRRRDLRAGWLHSSRLPRWPVAVFEFLLLIFIILNTALFAQAGVRALWGPSIQTATDREGWEVIAYGLAFHGSSLLCWLAFWALRRARRKRRFAMAAEAQPPPGEPAMDPTTTFAHHPVRTALVAFLAVIPILTVTSLGWSALLRACGLPDERQDIIDIFAHTGSPFIVTGIVLLATVIAPLNEELLFRAGIYRFLRDRISRPVALLLSSIIFASLHANLASFLPLTLLGLTLALAYENSGSLASPVILHSLFNLNTSLIVLTGLPELSP
ncbi:MAG: CPBP family intramembrane metalloprotease [Opitutaceae bacterium]|nr:CPBP family intramembrane metalloprotease [Opitutaceae bacterium]